ncbi:hypothetical protein OG21DRAFT_434941 [Imleria badia]|nr:hypothetical protein OG21DRAFT_434941 [Imleria badia]
MITFCWPHDLPRSLHIPSLLCRSVAKTGSEGSEDRNPRRPPREITITSLLSMLSLSPRLTSVGPDLIRFPVLCRISDTEITGTGNVTVQAQMNSTDITLSVAMAKFEFTVEFTVVFRFQ